MSYTRYGRLRAISQRSRVSLSCQRAMPSGHPCSLTGAEGLNAPLGHIDVIEHHINLKRALIYPLDPEI